MTNRQMILQLRKALRVLSISQLSTALGYRSPNTVANWLKDESVPDTAILVVEQFIRENIKYGVKDSRE